MGEWKGRGDRIEKEDGRSETEREERRTEKKSEEWRSGA